MSIKLTKIGTIEKGCDGNDLYLKVTDNEDDLTIDHIYDYVSQLVCVDTNVPGGFYIDTLRIFPDNLHNTFICVVEQRFNN